MIPENASWFVNHLWQSTVFVAAVWLVTLALKRNSAAARYWLWFAATLKFLVPLSLFVTFGSYLAALDTTERSMPSFAVGVSSTAIFTAVETDVAEVSSASPNPASPSSAIPDQALLLRFGLGIWILGFTLVLAIWFLR